MVAAPTNPNAASNDSVVPPPHESKRASQRRASSRPRPQTPPCSRPERSDYSLRPDTSLPATPLQDRALIPLPTQERNTRTTRSAPASDASSRPRPHTPPYSRTEHSDYSFHPDTSLPATPLQVGRPRPHAPSLLKYGTFGLNPTAPFCHILGASIRT
jgi:hypothetical protein